MQSHRSDRFVVAAFGDDERARLSARAGLLSGREVVFVGGGQSVDQLVATVVAEDAGTVVVDGDRTDLEALRAALAAADLAHVGVAGCDEPGTPRGVSGE